MWYGISDTLRWFSSYLTDIYQIVKIANCFSCALPTSCGVPRGHYPLRVVFLGGTTHFVWCSSGALPTSCGVPRGSVLGPLITFYSLRYSTHSLPFTLYATPLIHYLLLSTLLHSFITFYSLRYSTHPSYSTHNLDHHLYADDREVYLPWPPRI